MIPRICIPGGLLCGSYKIKLKKQESRFAYFPIDAKVYHYFHYVQY